MDTVCYIDIKGDNHYPVEVGLVLLCRETHNILDARVFYGKVVNVGEYKNGRCCHGMCRAFLEDGLCPDDMRAAVRELLGMEWNPKLICANGTGCRRFLRRCRVALPFINIELPPWVERDGMSYHRIAFVLKKQSAPIHKVSCNQKEAHPFPIRTRNELKKHLAQCALYDAVEVALADNYYLRVHMLKQLPDYV